MTSGGREGEPLATGGKPLPTGGIGASGCRGYRAPRAPSCLFVSLQVPDPVFQFRPVRPSPGLRLVLAVLLSLLAHAAFLLVPARPRDEPQAHAVPGRQAALGVRLVAPRALAPGRAALPGPEPVSSPAPPRKVAVPAVPAPEPAEGAGPVPDGALPELYRPASQLSRGPALLTPPAEDAWPSLPDTPPGRFQLELAIGADGSVDRVVPICDEAMCPAAGVYAELVSQWRFQPGDLEGQASPSRLRLEFEVGPPAEAGAPDDQALRQ